MITALLVPHEASDDATADAPHGIGGRGARVGPPIAAVGRDRSCNVGVFNNVQLGPAASPSRSRPDQEAASHADRGSMRYDRARVSLDRHATYIVAAFLAGAAR